MNRWLLFLLITQASLFSHASHAANTVSGRVYQDLNGNGSDSSEPGLSGARVTLDGRLGTVFHSESIVGSSGAFVFSPVSDGYFRLCAEAPAATPSWTATTPSCVDFALWGGKQGTSFAASFGFKQENGTEGCTRTQGYWGSSPGGQALLQSLVAAQAGSMMLLGSVGYTYAELDAILDSSVSTPGPGSNALINLAHQLIAAKANLLNGASAPSAVSNAIAAADALIGSLDMAPVGSSPQVDPASVQGQSMLAQKDILDVYNNGNAPGGPAHCDRGGR